MKQLNLPYYDSDMPRQGDSEYIDERCKIDLSVPEEVKSFPTLVWFHGGGMTSGGRDFPQGVDLTQIAVVAASYRFSGPRASCPDYIYDAAAAVAWTFRHIAEYGGDPSRVYVGGLSAGGYLSAMIALDAKYLGAFGYSPKQMAACVPLSGQMSTHFQVLNERRAKDPSTPVFLVDEFAPIGVAHADAPRMVMFTGDSAVDMPARVEENFLLAALLRRVYGAKYAVCHSIPDCDHHACEIPGQVLINQFIFRDGRNSEK